MASSDLEAWAAAYIEFQREPNRSETDPLWWAVEKFRSRDVNAEDCWRAILQILCANPPQNVIAVLAAGPLENLLVRHGAQFIDRVEQESRENAEFRYLLGGVWSSSIPWAVWHRVIAARAEEW